MLVKKLETFVPDDFLIRAGGERAKADFSSNGLGLRRALPAPAKEPKVPWILLLLPPLRTNAASSPDAGASRDHRGAAPSVRSSPAPETHPSGQAPTTGAQTASPKRGSNCVQAQPAKAQAATIAAQRRQFALRQHQKRTPAVKRRPPARRPRRLNAAATACRLSLPQAAREAMAWARILRESIILSMSMCSSGMWQQSTSPGKLRPKATVLGIMRE